MLDSDCIGALGGWEGCEVTDAQRFEAGVRGPRPQVWIELRPQFGRRMICDGCGEPVEKLHDQEVRVVRDLPIFDAETHLRLLRCGVACPRCGPRLERLTWLDRGLSPPWLFRNDESK